MQAKVPPEAQAEKTVHDGRTPSSSEIHMSQEESEGSNQESETPEAPSRAADEPSGREDHGRPVISLPPPAFPPGARRRAVRERTVQDSPEPGTPPSEFPRDAFIAPDDPIRKKGRGIPDDAFISPDDPLVPAGRDEEGQVTGMSLIPAARDESGSAGRETPNIHELPYLLDQLAEDLHDSGETALDVHPDMGHFQAALRAFLKGYLEGSGS